MTQCNPGPNISEYGTGSIVVTSTQYRTSSATLLTPLKIDQKILGSGTLITVMYHEREESEIHTLKSTGLRRIVLEKLLNPHFTLMARL